jgi:hypothetical protein
MQWKEALIYRFEDSIFCDFMKQSKILFLMLGGNSTLNYQGSSRKGAETKQYDDQMQDKSRGFLQIEPPLSSQFSNGNLGNQYLK